MFKRTSIFTAIALTLTLFAPVTPAKAASTLTLIASESFEYSGNLVGKNGGFGFTGAWASDSLSSDFYVDSTGFTYPNVVTAGGLIRSCSVFNGQLCAVRRDFAPQESGVFYLHLIANFSTQSGLGTPNLRFFDSATVQSGGVGANGAQTISIMDAGLGVKSDGTASAGTLNATSLIILQIDYISKTSQMWINPDMSTFDYINPSAPDAIYPGLAPKMARIAFYARNGVRFDEFKLYRVDRPAQPEIASASTPTTFSKGVVANLSATLDRSGKATFFARGERIPGCIAKSTPIQTPYTVTCAWKPAVMGSIPITVRVVPTTGTPTEIPLINAGVVKRTTRR